MKQYKIEHLKIANFKVFKEEQHLVKEVTRALARTTVTRALAREKKPLP
jgi:hypothetical protein